MKTKNLLSTFIALIIAINVFAQSIKPQKAIGGDSTDLFTCMDQTRDGGMIVGGYSWSNISDQKTESSRGSSDYWVIKLDRNGKIEWDKTIGGSERDELYSLQQTSDGGYILGGYSLSNISGEKTENNKGFDGDYWVVKLDASGTIQWDKTIGGNNGDVLVSVAQTKDKGFLLAGTSSSGISGDKTQRNYGSPDYWVVKIDSTGKVQWDKTIGGINNESLNAMQLTTDGGCILGGYSNSLISHDKTDASRGDYDYWVVKLDRNGKIEWDKTIGGSDVDYLFDLQQTSDGGYILGGTSWSNISGEKTEINRGGNISEADYWVVKLDASGSVQWDKTIGGSQYDWLYSLQQTIDGGYILGGYSNSDISGEKTENNWSDINSTDYWIVKLNNTGNIQWDKTIGGTDNDLLFSVKEIKQNVFLLGGHSSSQVSGDKTQVSRGGLDYWLVTIKYNSSGSLDIVEPSIENSITSKLNDKGFSVYPNPAINVLHIKTNSKATVILTDQSGKIILTKTIKGNGEINITQLHGGIYYLKNSETKKTEKILISK